MAGYGGRWTLLFVLFMCAWTESAAQNNQPRVGSGVEIAELPEESPPGTLIKTLTASDPDGDPITYSISANSVTGVILFEVSNETGQVRVGPHGQSNLDRESPSQCLQITSCRYVVITVSDGVNHDTPDPTITLFIILSDVNDNSPVFQNLPARRSFSENTNVGSTLFDTTATDDDSGDNGEIIFSLQGNSMTFAITHQTGIVSLSASLDYDDPETRFHTITIIASDRGNTSQSSASTLIIEVLDFNDLPPVFSEEQYSVSVYENLTYGDFVLRVSAYDQDRGVNDSIVYSIEQQQQINRTFSIDNATGGIFVSTASLDRETQPTHTFTVKATESGDATRFETAIVSITLLDINDNLPTFSQLTYAVNASESAPVSSSILDVFASDPDHEANGRFTFDLENLLNSSQPLPFSISGAGDVGTISLTQSLDFELTETYLMRVVAQEEVGGATRNASAEVRLNVVNENDNNPAFQRSEYNKTVPENAQTGYFVQQVVATDNDKGSYGQLTYRLVTGDFGHFNITTISNGGLVTTSGPLDYEDIDSYTISIQAIDTTGPGVEPRTAQTVLHVTIQNINDNHPQFNETQLTLVIDEEQAAGTVVADLAVTDGDGDDLTQRTFNISAGDVYKLFTFDPSAPNVLVTASVLDFDLNPDLRRWQLRVTVSDSLFEDEAILTILLQDINDNAPQFANTSYQFSVKEEEEAGTMVGQVVATDVDSELLGEIYFSLEGSTMFAINSSSGVIYTTAPIDREVQPTHTVTVVANDLDPEIIARQTASVQVTITVEDINDNVPVFQNTPYEFAVEENSPTVQISVEATDRDAGSNMIITYQIVSGNNNSAFLIADPLSGRISRNASEGQTLNRELVPNYDLVVMATDGGNPSNNVTAHVIINIMDVNDEDPQFLQSSYNTSISEDAPSGTTLPRAVPGRAVDRDTPPNARLTYSIISVTGPSEASLPSNPMPPSGTFTIGESSGLIETQGTFDREAFQGPYIVYVMVTDNGVGGARNGSAVVAVYLTDVNDNTPSFNPTTYSNSLSETIPPGLSVATVTATDRDNGPNKEISYSISEVLAFNDPDLQVFSHFAINSSSGAVVTNTTLDYEQVQRYRLSVLATDSGTNPRSSSATVTVVVEDANDHTPQFSQDSYSLNISEATLRNSRFPGPVVSDQDSGENSRISFTTDIITPFTVDPDTGELVVIATLDYESSTSYVFTVNASDHGPIPRSASAKVVVKVLDVNDNSPVFLSTNYSSTIPEANYSSSPYLLTTVRADDRDSSSFGEVRYRLVSGDDTLFSLHTLTGEVIVDSLVDFDTLSSSDATFLDMELVIEAYDRGSPSMSSSVVVTVTITDVNDNSPQFAEVKYTGHVLEGTQPGQEVVLVQATDADPSDNGLVRYSLDDIINFSIDEVTGEITTGATGASLNSTLYDFESIDKYNLVVTASDNGSVPLVTMVMVEVLVVDANDNDPVITAVTPPTLTVPEDQLAPFHVASVQFSDADSGDNAKVDYQLSDDGGLFVVSGTGNIALDGSLDRETAAYYNITITITDRGQPRNMDVAYLLISVSDVNDNTPIFAQSSYTAVVGENVSLSSVVATLRVEDRDDSTGPNGRVQFSITSGDSSAFRLEEREVGGGLWEADIVTQKTFDYEAGPRLYTLGIRASDSAPQPNFDISTVTITILDENDNPPRFSLSSYSLQAPEDMPISGVVGAVLAIDPDGASNGVVDYFFATGTSAAVSSQFSLHQSTGVISLLSALNYEVEQAFSFSVVAMDRGSPQQSSSASVSVAVLDVNEFSPVFDKNEYVEEIQENSSPPTFVVQVNATEPEAGGVIGSIQYSIAAGPAADFAIDPVSGVVTAIRRLDRETMASYVLTIQARDSGGDSSRTGYSQLIVMVSDTNDNTPSFSSSSFSYLLPENSPSGTALSPTQLATDKDDGVNSDLRYSLSPSELPFAVDALTGVVTISSTLDRETTATYTLSLVATDQGAGNREGRTDIIITVMDVRDNDPEFDQAGYSGSVEEGSPPGVAILTVTATDDDVTDFITYSIAGGDSLGQFSIGPLSGVITTGAAPLDRETVPSYFLTVRATDLSSRSMEVTVEVEVEDRNDVRPSFPQDTLTISLEESNTISQVVATVTAQDTDLGTNALVHYSITGGNGLSIFSIPDTTSGEVVARAEGLDYETQREHYLTIQATDQATPSALRLSSTMLLTVTVLDTNDNRPIFSPSRYMASVSEGVASGATVTSVTASDADSGTNGLVTFSFQTPTSVFSINSTTGLVILTGELNFELDPEYDLNILARDRGNPPLSSVAALHIDVLNINDNSPRFLVSFYTEEVSEDAPPSTPVGRVVAMDPDSPGAGSLSYSISPSSDPSGYFLINDATGDIFTARSLDRETVAVVNLLVVAEDVDKLNGTATVQVTVMDVNDNPPQFSSPSYSSSLRENSRAGTTLIPVYEGNTTRVVAVDSDGPGLNSEVSYDKAGPDKDLFSVDKDTGIVTVAPGAMLDREADATLELVVTAEDHGNPVMTSSVTMTISLLDENDNAPSFSPQFGYLVEVEEGSIPSAALPIPVVANDPDIGASGSISFFLSSSSPPSLLSSFTINSTSGEIALINELDREVNPLIILTIGAKDDGEPTLISTTEVQVTVADVNDNAPIFSQNLYITTIPEYLAVGSSTLQLSAADPDVGTNGRVQYSVVSAGSAFTADLDTGLVTTITGLDYETQTTYNITLQACDEAPQPHRMCSLATLLVSIEDFNDEPPTFDLSSYRTDACSSTVAGSNVMRVAATDRDSGENAQLEYSLRGNITDLLGVRADTGHIFLTRIAREQEVGSEVTAVVVATDGGPSPLSGSTQVIVQLLNCSQDPFRFIQPLYSFSEEEYDALGNAPPNTVNIGQLSFSRSTLNPVSLRPAIPQSPFSATANFIFVASEMLDREVRDIYILQVSTSSNDPVPQLAHTVVEVEITDVNDEPPQFQLTTLSFTALENDTAPVAIATLVATDNDIGANADVQYSLSPANPLFSINSSTGVVSTATELDRESISSHSLIIRAYDGRSVATETIVVEVVDANDNSPQFDNDEYDVSIVENNPSGTSVVMVIATDRDLGRNADIRYTKTGGDISVFDLDSSTGVIRTLTALDYETRSAYLLIVTAADNGVPPNTNAVNVNITVEDFNDSPPAFLNAPSKVTISEGAAVGSLLTDFNVTDGDSGPRGASGARFSIIAGDTNQFAINAISGILRTTTMLDREQQGSECTILSIQAIDSAGANSLSAVTEIEICVADVNDNCPVFTEPSFSITIPEDEDLNQGLLSVQSTDLDSGSNGLISYSLLNDREGKFDIFTGVLSLVATLDRESQDSYELVVRACDGGTDSCCSNTTVAVTVGDINDNRPVINNIPTTCIRILETGRCGDQVTEVGDVIFTLNATDADTGLRGTVIFPPLQDTNLPFDLSVAGVITIAAPLDYELEREYTLYISARDQGSSPQTSELGILCVRVEDINDNPPLFPTTPYIITQAEETVPTAPLAYLLATDADQTGSNQAAVEYSLISGNSSLFSLSPSTGALTLLLPLNCELVSSYSLTVLANNSVSSCALTSQVSVVVTVTDINDNTPVFDAGPYSADISENATLGTFVVAITARDSDKSAPNNALLYRFQASSGPNPFHIDVDTGRITIQNSLDRETHPDPYKLMVVVEDKGAPPQSSSVAVTITLLDVNDEPPLFSKDTFITEVNEGETAFPLQILSVPFSDADSLAQHKASSLSITLVTARGLNGATSTLSTASSPFRIELSASGTEGVLYLEKSLDRETIESYDVTIRITNRDESCSPGGCYDDVVVTITVSDINDNRPCFPMGPYSGEVSVTAVPGTLVLKTTASDPDSGNFGAVGYRLEGADGRFRIEPETGNLFTRGSFEKLDGQTINLAVTAFDNMGVPPSLSCGTNVVLVVLNDFQRIRVHFGCGVDNIVSVEDRIVETIMKVSGLNIKVESYADYSSDSSTNFLFHATDPMTNEIISFEEFFSRLQEDGQMVGTNKLDELISTLRQFCIVIEITAFADIDRYTYPPPLDAQIIVILVLCLLLVLGAMVCLALSVVQRWVALHDTRSKLLADVFYGSPGSTSIVMNVQQENIQLEEFEIDGNRQNPMFVQPYENWDGLDTSAAESTDEMSSLRRDNPLYESQEIRMEMFADVSDTEGEGDEADDAELLAAALKDDEEVEDNSVTAI